MEIKEKDFQSTIKKNTNYFYIKEIKKLTIGNIKI